MNARFLLAVFDSVYLVALTAWVGSLLFFSFVLRPVIAEGLDEAAGAKFVRMLFPRYYTWGAIAGAISLPAYLGVPLSFQELRGPLVALQSLMIMAGTLLMLYAANSLAPAIQAAAATPVAADLDSKPRLARLHRRAVWVNGVVLVLGLLLLIAFANRPAPRTAGIVEPTPLERARLEYEQLKSRMDPRRTDRAVEPGSR